MRLILPYVYMDILMPLGQAANLSLYYSVWPNAWKRSPQTESSSGLRSGSLELQDGVSQQLTTANRPNYDPLQKTSTLHLPLVISIDSTIQIGASPFPARAAGRARGVHGTTVLVSDAPQSLRGRTSGQEGWGERSASPGLDR